MYTKGSLIVKEHEKMCYKIAYMTERVLLFKH